MGDFGIGEAGIAQSYDGAAAASRLTSLAIATLEGDVFRGPHLVSGGGRAESRGILETKREIKELRDRIAALEFRMRTAGGRPHKYVPRSARLKMID